MYDEQPLVAVRIKDGIFCGNVTAAYDEDFLIMNKVTHIINCAGGETRDLFKNSGIQYLNFPWSQPPNTTSGPNLFDASDKNIETIVRFIDETLAQGECILVQSVHGRSRSCAIVAAYFVIKYRWTLDHALDFIAMAHEDMEVHPFFRKQLAQFYQKHEIPPSQTGRALDIFHPEIDEDGFALDNEQWMLRNTYINGLVNEVQEKTDLYKVAIARVALNEPNPKAAQKRRRRITFCDTKQGTSVACMWTQPVVQPRNATPVIAPPSELSMSIVSRPGTPNGHRLEGEATANVHTATPITAIGIPGDPHRANTIKLQLRSNIMPNLQKQQQSVGIASGLSLHRDSPMIGRGPALVATGSLNHDNEKLDAANSSSNQQQQYNQTVSRILPSSHQDNNNNNESSYGNNNNYGSNNINNNNNGNEIPRAFNNNSNNVRNTSTNNNNVSSNLPQAPTAANIAASLGTTGQGNVITLRGGAPLSVITAGNNNNNNNTSTGTSTTSTAIPTTTTTNPTSFSTTSSQPQQQMRPIPDANSGIRPLGSNSNNNNEGLTIITTSSNGNNNNGSSNSLTPHRPGPTIRGTTTTGVQPGHNRNNPFTLPVSGRTTHRGSPLPMQRNSGASSSAFAQASTSNSGGVPSRLFAGTASSQNRTNSPIRNSNSTLPSNNMNNNNSSSNMIGGGTGLSPRTNSPMAMNRNLTGSSNNNNNGNASTGSPIRNANLTSFSQYHTQQRLNASGGSSSLAPISTSNNNGRGNSPSAIGNRPSSPNRQQQSSSSNNTFPTSSSNNNNTAGRSMIGGGGSANGGGGTTTSSGWGSSLLPNNGSGILRSTLPGSNSNVNNSGTSYTGAPRTGSPIVRSNSPVSQMRNTIPSAGTNQISLQNPPSRPASISQQLSSHPSSHIPRQNSPMSFGSNNNNTNASNNNNNSNMMTTGRRTDSPVRNNNIMNNNNNNNVTSSSMYGGGYSSLGNNNSSSGMPLQRTNSPLAANRVSGGISSFSSNNNNANNNNASSGGGSLAEQFLYRSSAGVGNSNGNNNNGRNSPLMRR